MRDFGKDHRKTVTYFGIWNEEGRDRQLGDRDAWNILCEGVRKSPTQDIREDSNVLDALDWFEHHIHRPRPVKDFRKSLNTQDPAQRYFELRDALSKIKQYMGY